MTAPVRVPEEIPLASGAQVRLCIRSESLALQPASAAGDGQVLVPAMVARRAFLGDLMRYWVAVDTREWIVKQPDPGAGANFDRAVQIAIGPERIHVIAEAGS